MLRTRYIPLACLLVATFLIFRACGPAPTTTGATSGPAAGSGALSGVESWAPAMSWVASPHFRPVPRTPADVDAIVIHTTEGSYDESLSFEANQARVYEGTIRYFERNSREVSAHFVIGPYGEVTQMVDEADIAHTQTYYNARSLGIECAGWSDRPETWTSELLDSLVELTAYLAVKWDVPVVRPAGDANTGPHSVDASDAPDGRSTPSGRRFNGAGIVAHAQIQPWNRTDPGPHFPWESFLARVRARVESMR